MLRNRNSATFLRRRRYSAIRLIRQTPSQRLVIGIGFLFPDSVGGSRLSRQSL